MTPASFPATSRRPAWRNVLDRWRARRASRRLLPSPPGHATLAAPVSQPVTRRQCEGPLYARWCALIREAPKLHRKQWEYAYVLSVLDSAGMLEPGRRGLGFGVGREPLVSAIAACGASVHATDLPPDDAAAALWRATGEYAGDVQALNERGICPAEEFDRLVTFGFADMRDLAHVDGDFDFLWSSCALEHLGSLGAGLDFVRASMRLLRPGGVAVHTTEYNASSADRTIAAGPVVLYRRRDLEALARDLTSAGHALTLDFDTGDTPEDRHVDSPPHDDALHLKVLYGTYATTSFGLHVRKRDGSGPDRPRRGR